MASASFSIYNISSHYAAIVLDSRQLYSRIEFIGMFEYFWESVGGYLRDNRADIVIKATSADNIVICF
jgi:hypothetical protein